MDQEPVRAGRGAAALLSAALTALLVSCGHAQPAALPTPTMTSPDSVLEAYLAAFKQGDCVRTEALTAGTFRVGNGQLCGSVTISDYRNDGFATTADDSRVYSVRLVVSQGSADGTVPEGDVTWFYSLTRQPDATWLLTGGGSGP